MISLLRRWEAQLFGDIGLTPSLDTPTATKFRRVLVLSVSAGNGHVRAAEAIAAWAKADFPRLAVRHLDLMQVFPSWFRKLYADLYVKLASGLPEAWGWLYRKTDRESTGSLAGRLRRTLQRVCARRLFREIDAFAPDVIVCTHFLPAELLADARRDGRLTCPLWVQVTDFDLHRFWLHEGVTGYFVANEELAYRLRGLGHGAARVVISGIPVMPAFSARPERRVASRRLGLSPERMTVLLMGGGAGIGMSAERVATLLDRHPSVQLIVMAGRNAALLSALQDLSVFYPQRLCAIGFTSEVALLMAASDLAITKPGGLSVSECLAMGLPMLLAQPIPGQEERNADYLLQQGVALRADDPLTLHYRLQQLLNDPRQLTLMRERSLAIARPFAARDLLLQIG